MDDGHWQGYVESGARRCSYESYFVGDSNLPVQALKYSSGFRWRHSVDIRWSTIHDILDIIPIYYRNGGYIYQRYQVQAFCMLTSKQINK
jgi:hypothetical protein